MYDFLLDLCSYQTETVLSVLPLLQSDFQSTPAVWSINLSKIKASILHEMLKLQPEKKHVELTGCSHEESEVMSFLQCVPYISQLSVELQAFDEAVGFFVNLFCAAAEKEQQTGEKILELLSSVCSYKSFPYTKSYINDEYQCSFLLDLYSHAKDCETKTGLSVLPSLHSVFQSAPAVWLINLSERKSSILLEVLKLQSEKKEVELTGCSHEESEVMTFLLCLPYISQLSFEAGETGCCWNLFSKAAEQQTGEKILASILTFCREKMFPSDDTCMNDIDKGFHCNSLLDLYSHVKDYETKTGLSFLPSLHSVFQSTPAVWSINLSEKKSSVLLEVLKLQSEKKEVELTDYSHEESEVMSFLQCLPYISQLRVKPWRSDEAVGFFVNLFCAAAEREQQTGEKILELLSSVCSYKSFPYCDRYMNDKYQCGFLLDLYSYMKHYETKTGLSVLPSLHSVFQSAPAVWSINLSERKSSILLEVLKLQSEKKEVELTGCSHEESEVMSFLQCLPYISQLSVGKNHLLRFIQCCAACEAQQEAASGLLRTLQHRLDLSCSSSVRLSEKDQTEPLSLTADDCRAVSTILMHSSQDTHLDLRDCKAEDSAPDLLFSVLHRVHLRVSKTVLLQLLSLVPVNSERDTVRRAVSLCRALGGKLDLSHTTLDQRSYGALVQMLDLCEGLTQLDLSHCQLTDQLLLPLITHLHKVQVLNLSHNKITDASTDALLQLLSINPSIDSVRLFRNNIVNRAAFKEHKQFEIESLCSPRFS